MNWKPIIDQLRIHGGMTLEEIGAAVDLPKSAIHRLHSGAIKSTSYERGCRLVDLHRKVMRRKSRAKPQEPA